MNEFYASVIKLDEIKKLKESKHIKVSLVVPSIHNMLPVNYKSTFNFLLKNKVVDEILIMYDNYLQIPTIKNEKIFYINTSNVLPQFKGYGKGLAMWKGVYNSSGDIIVFVDSDIENFNYKFVTGLLWPLLRYRKFVLSKGFYERYLKIDGKLIKGEGGRITELGVKPLLSLFLPQLLSIYQPLSGEIAAPRDVLEKINFYSNYDVDLNLLIDIYKKFGIKKIAQVYLGKKIHANKPLSELSLISFKILASFLIRMKSLPTKEYSYLIKRYKISYKPFVLPPIFSLKFKNQ